MLRTGRLVRSVAVSELAWSTSTPSLRRRSCSEITMNSSPAQCLDFELINEPCTQVLQLCSASACELLPAISIYITRTMRAVCTADGGSLLSTICSAHRCQSVALNLFCHCSRSWHVGAGMLRLVGHVCCLLLSGCLRLTHIAGGFCPAADLR